MKDIDIEDYFDMVRFIANKFYGDKDDMFQIGCISLMRAKKYYNPKRGKFSTIAYKCVLQDIIKYIKKEKKQRDIVSAIKNNRQYSCFYETDDSFMEYYPKMDAKETILMEMRNDGFTIKEIAGALNIKASKVEQINQRAKKRIANANKDIL